MTEFTYEGISYTKENLSYIGDKLAHFWKGRYTGYVFSIKQARIKFNYKGKKTKFVIEMSFSHLRKYIENEEPE